MENTEAGSGPVLTLFIADGTPNSTQARAQLQAWLDRRRGAEGVTLEVVDVLQHPELAERERVFATPTLLRHSPLPRRKLVGDLSDWETVVRSLDLAEGRAR